eukprot:TRINITY_DN97612_c0_g1_i1.p1 TRINITY_DN97612_c0_g1~~TRINITY_DN97612_c0_g1_i1.p1  ORF type:complete len:216 (-),score=55.40 TRINITY_DN97612_c0_g1_i1:327-974(-)
MRPTPALILTALAASWVLPVAESETSPMSAATSELHKAIEINPITCSSCLWIARALRNALVEKMPKSVKSAKERHRLTKMLLEGNLSETGSCGAKYFPKDLIVASFDQDGENETYAIHDFEKVRGDKDPDLPYLQTMLTTKETAENKIGKDCPIILGALKDIIVKRVEAHGPRVYGAVTERWLCHRWAKLCDDSEAKPGKDDIEDEDGDDEKTEL